MPEILLTPRTYNEGRERLRSVSTCVTTNKRGHEVVREGESGRLWDICTVQGIIGGGV